MAFKDDVVKDLNIFFDINGLAAQHTIDGRTLKIIVDNDRLIQRSKKEYDGISVGEILYYVNAVDFGERPKQGASQIFDGRPCLVFDCREDEGVYEVILQQNRGL